MSVSQWHVFVIRIFAAATLLTYLYLEGNPTYQMVAIAISILIWLSSYVRKAYVTLFLYSVFLGICAATYALTYGFTPLGTCTAFWLWIVCLRLAAPFPKVPAIQHAVIGLIATEGIVLSSSISPEATFVCSVFLTLLSVYDLAFGLPRRLEIWRKPAKYGKV